MKGLPFKGVTNRGYREGYLGTVPVVGTDPFMGCPGASFGVDFLILFALNFV